MSHQRDWEELADYDAMWAILSDPAKRGGGWDEQEFFATGFAEVDEVLAGLESKGLRPTGGRALDFGCGYGRLTRALAERLGSAVGVDISEQMVAGATQLNAGTTAEFVVNAGGDLAQFDDASFELIYSRIVLQHVPTRREILAYVAEFVRVLRPGGVAVFQIPSRIAPKHRIQPVARAYRALRAVGVPAKVLLEKLHLQPMRMTAVPVAAVTAEVERAGARVAEVDLDREPSGNESATYFVTR